MSTWFDKHKWKGWTIPSYAELLFVLILGLVAVVRADILQETSQVSTNWQTMTNYVECHIGDTNGDSVVYFPRDSYLLGIVTSNRYDTILHNGKPVSKVLVESNIVLRLKVTFTTNVVAHTNLVK